MGIELLQRLAIGQTVWGVFHAVYDAQSSFTKRYAEVGLRKNYMIGASMLKAGVVLPKMN